MKHVRIRTSLLGMLLPLMLALSGAILIVNYMAGKKIAEDLGNRYLGKTRELVRNELDSFFQPVMTSLKHGRVWARDGVVIPREEEKSNAVYLPVLAAYPQVTSIATGDESGYSYRLGAKGENYLNRITYAGKPGRPADYAIRKPDGTVIERYSKETQKFDPRARPWYRVARENLAAAGGDVPATRIAWTDPFILNTSKNPGIAASLPYLGPGDDLYMMTFNVMLTKLSNFTSSLRPSDNGMAFVLTEDGRVVGFPATDEYDTAEKRLAHIKALGNRMPKLDELGQPALARAAAQWEGIHAAGRLTRLPLDVDGEAWRTVFKPYELDEGPPLWIGVAVPESDFLALVREQQRMILWVSMIALLCALGLAMLLARMYSRPLRRLARESERITSLDLTPGPAIETHVLEAHLLAQTQERMRAALDSFSRYIPTAVVQELLKRGEAARLGGREMSVSILFSDIRGFTTISEGMTPNDLTEHLAEYFEALMDIIREEGGAVDKMVGDAIMAMWGAPVENEAHARGAVRAAVRCGLWLIDFNKRCVAEDRPPLWTGFGIATGDAYVGNFGAPSRLNFTALGDVVNLASRLEGANKMYGATVICSDDTRQAAGDDFVWMHLDTVSVKGKKRAGRIYAPLGLRDDVDERVVADAKCYEAGLAEYAAGHFEKAAVTLRDIPESSPVRAMSNYLTWRCEHLIQNPPASWDGIWRLEQK